MSYKSHRTGPDRVFDHLYDPLYITSGSKNIWKENHNALYRSAPVRIYPQYGTMFTDLPGRPRNYYIQQRNPLPHFPFIDENGTYNNSKEVGKRKAVVGGRDRAKFFNIPLTNELTMNLQLDIKNEHACCGHISLTPIEAFRTVACETIYREQSAQTKPWMPDAIVDDNCSETPELVYAAKAIDSNEGPGILEVKKLERARRRRQLEKSFAKSKHSNDWNMRRAFLEALEWEDRVGREDEIEYCQQLRLEMVKKMMDARENKMKNNFTTQMDETVKRLDAQKEKKLNNLRIKHQRTLRRLDKQFGDKSRRSRDLAPEHKQTSFISYNTDFQARLDELHKMPTMPTNLERFIQPKVDITKPKQPIKEVKKGLWTEKFLMYLYESLRVIQKKIVYQRAAKCLIDIHEEVLSYVSTNRPSVETYDNELEYQHAVFLQKIIKGRAVQSILHDGKNENQDLIDQLKETFKLESVWKAECAEDWNEDSMMEFLRTYMDQEFDRYAKQKEIRDRRISAEQEQRQKEIDEKNRIQQEKEEIALDYFGDVFTDFFGNLTNVDCIDSKEITHDNQIEDGALHDQSYKDMVSDVLSNVVLPEIYKRLPDEQSDHQVERKNDFETLKRVPNDGMTEEIVKDTIDHILQKVISHPAEDVTNSIIDEIVNKTVELTSASEDINADTLDKEIGGMLDQLYNQIFTSMNESDENDDDSDSVDD